MAEKHARCRAVERVAPEVIAIDAEWVDPPAVTFRSGQFLSVRCGPPSAPSVPSAPSAPSAPSVPGVPSVPSVNVRRSYSLCSTPQRAGFELLVKLVPGGVGSDYFRHLAPGDDIPYTGPMGFFVCELTHPGDAVWAATGVGIAAALPMIQETLARPVDQESGRVLLRWGLRRQEELFWLDRLDALRHGPGGSRFDYEVFLSQPTAGWRGGQGRITSVVLGEAARLERPVFYLVGNGDMVRDVREGLVGLGFDRRRQIRTEVFHPATVGTGTKK